MGVLRPAGDFDRTYRQDMAVIRHRWQFVLLLLFLVALYLLPLYASGSRGFVWSTASASLSSPFRA